MRAMLGLLCLGALVGAQEDLTPRSGAGWEGFKKDSTVRMKQTHLPAGQAPRVTLLDGKLLSVAKTTLVVGWTPRNSLGVGQIMQKQTLPRSGEAAANETQKVEQLGNESLRIGGKKLPCSKRRTTVTGAGSKRIITEWIAASPRVLAKKQVSSYAGGKVVASTTLLLSSAHETRKVGSKQVTCQKYRVVQRSGGFTERGEAFLSREVPGGTVWTESKRYKDGVAVATVRIECLGFKSR